MSAQSQLLGLASSVTGSIGAIGGLAGNLGKDKIMADKARNTLKQKIQVTQQNHDAASTLRAKLDIGGVE